MDKCREENSKRRIMYSSELGCPLLDRANSEKCREENSEGRIMYSSLTEELGCPLLDSANSALWISAADNLAKMAKFFKKRLLPCLSNQQAQVIQGSVEDHYILDWVIDNCATHKIRACYLKASRNPVFCCKSFYKECDGGENAGTIFQSELQIMHRLRNQCGIVKLKGGYEDSQFFHLVMEYCKEGDLWHFVERNGGLWNAEYEASCIFRQIVNAIQSCHRMGILHGDIKLRNVFLSSTGRDWEIKLGDFGSSKVFSKGEIFKGDIIGTLPYMAPEILQSQGYCEAVDIWSAGVLLYKLLCGYYPFGEVEEDSLTLKHNIMYKAVDVTGAPWHNISDSAKDLISRILKRNPSERLTVKQILEHEWLKQGGLENIARILPCFPSYRDSRVSVFYRDSKDCDLNYYRDSRDCHLKYYLTR